MKDVFNVELIKIAGHVIHERSKLHGYHFDFSAFVTQASNQLSTLELKQRSQQIQQALSQHLPSDFALASQILLSALHPVEPNQSLDEIKPNKQGLCGWVVMPMADYIGLNGQGHIDTALNVLQQMTQRFTSEFGIRYLLLNQPSQCLSIMATWLDHECHHVRRLVSEGTRPLLPWAMQLPEFKANPNSMLPLLESLRDDSSEYVRRSVANHLNDISKTHPDVVAGIAQDWLNQKTQKLQISEKTRNQNRKRLVKHACRTLIKAGHPKTLSAFGYYPPKDITTHLKLDKKHMSLGETLSITCELINHSGIPFSLLVDYQVRHMKANGKQTSKTFKWKEISLLPGERAELIKEHKIVPISTRRYYSGEHGVDIQVNGKKLAEASFYLEV